MIGRGPVSAAPDDSFLFLYVWLNVTQIIIINDENNIVSTQNIKSKLKRAIYFSRLGRRVYWMGKNKKTLNDNSPKKKETDPDGWKIL